MGSVFLRGDSWVGEYKDRGRIKRKTFGKKGIITKTMAKEMLRKREQMVKRGEYDMLDAEIPTLNEFSKSYVEHQRDVKQVRSFDRTRVAVNHFSRFFGGKKLSELTPEDIDIYKQRRLEEGVQPGTIKRELHVIRHLFNQARKWKKFFGENPVSQSSMPEVYDQKERVLSPEEELRLIEELPNEFKPIILVALNTGMRLGEILGLRWEWIDLEDNIIYLPQTHTKSKRSRRVPINPIVRKILLEGKIKSRGSELIFPRDSYYSFWQTETFF
jgi:integrase